MQESWHQGWQESWRTFRGIARSLRIYYGDGERRAAMERLYGQFVRPGDLAFDIGAHVGDRTRAFRALGARVVAVEPGTTAMRVLRLLHGRDARIALVAKAVGAAEGESEFRVNSRNPSVSTLSPEFTASTAGAPGWEGQRWDRTARVSVTTLDALIAAHGRPDFVKIDRHFIESIHRDAVKREFVGSILKMAEASRAQVIAEGIETHEELSTLASMGVDLVQGYLLGRPTDRPSTAPIDLDGLSHSTEWLIDKLHALQT